MTRASLKLVNQAEWLTGVRRLSSLVYRAQHTEYLQTRREFSHAPQQKAFVLLLECCETCESIRTKYFSRKPACRNYKLGRPTALRAMRSNAVAEVGTKRRAPAYYALLRKPRGVCPVS